MVFLGELSFRQTRNPLHYPLVSNVCWWKAEGNQGIKSAWRALRSPWLPARKTPPIKLSTPVFCINRATVWLCVIP